MDLEQAAVAAGLSCPKVNTPATTTGGLPGETVYCSTTGGDLQGQPEFTVFDNQADLTTVRKDREAVAHDKAAEGSAPNSLLVGPTWLISAELGDIKVIQPKLGGTVEDLSTGTPR